MISVANNMLAMNAQRMYKVNTDNRRKSTEKLASGYKINRAADDAAGLTISEKMRSQVRGLNQGSDNIQDGISLVQIADGALAEVNDMLHRMTELSVKSANGTNTDADRQAIQKEISQIIAEIDRIHESTEYNTMPLFDGNYNQKTGKLGANGLVSSPSAEAGIMSEKYQGKAAAILNFNRVDAGNISELVGIGFGFQCAMGCSETFRFTFEDDPLTISRATNPGSNMDHSFVINLHGLSSGADIVNEITSTVDREISAGNLIYRTTPESSLTYGRPIGHANGLDSSGSELIVYSWSSSKGNVDAQDLINAGKGDLGKPVWIQASGRPNDGINIMVERMDAEYIGISKIDVSSEYGARTAIGRVTKASAKISEMRSNLGAYQNRLEHSYDNNNNKAENTQAAESRIRDTDMATEMVNNSKHNILIQAGEAMMAQANQSTQGVLSILGA